MDETGRIVEQLRCSFYKGAWHGPSLLESLEGVKARQASKHPVPNAHSIWELVLHSTTWIKAVEKTLAELIYTAVTDESNWPKITATDEVSWQKAVAELKKAHRKLEKYISQLKDPALEKIPANTNSTVYRLLHGVIQHNIYHAGQISLLKKAK
jgi:uncharacterized damage-inducible protein DinB